MRFDIRPACMPQDIPVLMALDDVCFGVEERFTAETWATYEAHIARVDGNTVGACAFAPHQTIAPTCDRPEKPEHGTLYIISTAIIPEWRGRGLGRLLKAWQIAHARAHGFMRIVTNMRVSNAASRHLNEELGFIRVRRLSGFYPDGEDTFVYEKPLA